MAVEHINNWVDALYARLLLRDVFGKITPGAILLLSIWASFPYSNLNSVLNNLSDKSAWLWLLYLGVSWITGCAIQAFGQVISLFKCHEDEKSYQQRLQFDEKSKPYQRQQLERYTVIKEACGNGYVSILLSIITLGVNEGIRTDNLCEQLKDNWHLVIAVTIIILSMGCMHFKADNKHQKYINTIIGNLSD